jgi:hypothetical protein
MKRKLKWLAIVLAVSLLGFDTALLLWPPDRVTAESWQKIRIGMTEEEVAEILGSPSVSYAEFQAECVRLQKELGKPAYKFDDPRMEEPQNNERLVVWDRVKIWTGRRGSMMVELDQDNHVTWKHFLGGGWINGGILDRLRDWLGW